MLVHIVSAVLKLYSFSIEYFVLKIVIIPGVYSPKIVFYCLKSLSYSHFHQNQEVSLWNYLSYQKTRLS